jgi:hypothetical protein
MHRSPDSRPRSSTREPPHRGTCSGCGGETIQGRCTNPLCRGGAIRQQPGEILRKTFDKDVVDEGDDELRKGF